MSISLSSRISSEKQKNRKKCFSANPLYHRFAILANTVRSLVFSSVPTHRLTMQGRSPHRWFAPNVMRCSGLGIQRQSDGVTM
jgi:hypothetical protein